MELTNEFTVNVPVAEAWKVLTDVERIAPLLPGAQLQEVEGDEYRGVVKVKVGPITAQYKGAATFEEVDEPAGRVVLKASGRDTRGQGNASATITATMSPSGPAGQATRVTVVTDLTVTGKVAQFGRGVLADVSAKLMAQFADALAADLAAGSSEAGESAGVGTDGGSAGGAGSGRAGELAGVGTDGGSAGGAGSGRAGVRRVEQGEVEAVDLLAVAGGSVLRRVAPAIGVLAVLALVVVRRRRRRAGAAAAS